MTANKDELDYMLERTLKEVKTQNDTLLQQVKLLEAKIKSLEVEHMSWEKLWQSHAMEQQSIRLDLSKVPTSEVLTDLKSRLDRLIKLLEPPSKD